MSTSSSSQQASSQPLNGSEEASPYDVHIDDSAPQRYRNVNDLAYAVLSLILAVAVIILATYLRGTTSGVQSDAHTALTALGWLMDVPASVLQQLVTVTIVVGMLVQMAFQREWAQAALSVVAMFLGYGIVWGVSLALSNFGGSTLIASLDSPSVTSSMTLLPDIYAAIGALLTLAGPHRMKPTVKWGWNTLFILAALEIAISWHSFSGVLVSFALGRLVGLLLRFAVGVQGNGVWGVQIVQAMHNIGINPISVTRRKELNASGVSLKANLDDDLIENSRIYDAEDGQGTHYIVSVLDAHMHAAGYLNQLWQWVRLNGIAMRRDRSASDANHHHLAMVLGIRDLGLTSADAYGVADIADSSIMVFRDTTSPSSCDLAALDDDDMQSVMRYLHTAHCRGFTHRRIAPQSIARTHDGAVYIAGWQNGDFGSGSANIAVDRVQLITMLASCAGVERTIRLAQSVWTDAELSALIPFIQKAAIPTATSDMPTWDSSILKDLRTGLKALAPQEAGDAIEPAPLSRFNIRTFVTIVLGIIAAAVIFTQLRPNEVIAALTNANPIMAVLCVLCGIIAWIGSAIGLQAFMTKGRDQYMALFCSQAASGFTAVSMPAGIGPAFVNLQFLRKLGYRNTAATATMSASLAVQGVTVVIMMLIIGISTGRNTLSSMIPSNTVIIVIGVVTLVASAAMAIAPIRRRVLDTVVPLVRIYAHQFIEVLSQPRQMAICAAGSILLNVSTGLGFWIAMLGFGYYSNPVETIFIFLLANAVGSAVPTPGGLGAVEAALTFAFTSAGVPAAIALSATLLYRVSFYWLRIPMGAAAMKWLDKRGLI